MLPDIQAENVDRATLLSGVLWIPSFFAVYAIIMETVTSADQEKIYLIWEAV